VVVEDAVHGLWVRGVVDDVAHGQGVLVAVVLVLDGVFSHWRCVVELVEGVHSQGDLVVVVEDDVHSQGDLVVVVEDGVHSH